MGLDQAIRKMSPEVAGKIIKAQEADEDRDLTEAERDTIVEVWDGRKENHIHRYMDEKFGVVKNCDYYFLTEEDMLELTRRLREVNDDHSKAAELLPTRDGFFFGTTEYDEWYFRDIESELETFTQILMQWDSNARYAYWAWW